MRHRRRSSRRFASDVQAEGFHIVGGGTIEFAKDTDEDVRRLFEYARDAGMPTIVATCNPPVVPRLERFAKQFDIKVAIHNHGPEDTKFPSPYDVLAAVKGMDPRIGLCIDIGHTVRTGTDVVKAIIDAGPRVLDLHAKDLRDLKEKGSQCIVGEGEIPIPRNFPRTRTRSVWRICQSRIRNRHRRSAARDETVVRLHARCARRHGRCNA